MFENCFLQEKVNNNLFRFKIHDHGLNQYIVEYKLKS